MEFTRFEIYMLMNQVKPLWLSGADLSGADLRFVDLHDSDLRGADLSGADLSFAYLNGALLNGSNLSGAKLRTASLHDITWGGAIYDKGTIWPNGFDPVKAGAILQP